MIGQSAYQFLLGALILLGTRDPQYPLYRNKKLEMGIGCLVILLALAVMVLEIKAVWNAATSS